MYRAAKNTQNARLCKFLEWRLTGSGRKNFSAGMTAWPYVVDSMAHRESSHLPPTF